MGTRLPVEFVRPRLLDFLRRIEVASDGARGAKRLKRQLGSKLGSGGSEPNSVQRRCRPNPDSWQRFLAPSNSGFFDRFHEYESKGEILRTLA
jgi:hypothetical protein